jgi:hypothetical protein
LPELSKSKDIARDNLLKKKQVGEFDVFLCYNSVDIEYVKKIDEILNMLGILPWFDIRNLPPGKPWQDELQKKIPQINSAAVFLGKDGLGPWQDLEIKAFLTQFRTRYCPVIPVMLPNYDLLSEIPPFLNEMHMVDFRKPYPNPLNQLIWGITKTEPENFEPWLKQLISSLPIQDLINDLH